MSRFVVIERKRVIPLILLVVLMGGLSLYDSVRDNFSEVTPTKEEGAKKSKTIKEEDLLDKEVEFVTADTGFKINPKNFEIAKDLDSWIDIIEKNNLGLPDYPYNEYTEVGIFSFNSKIKDIKLEGENEKPQVVVKVREKDEHYHVATVPKKPLTRENQSQNWRFLNEKGETIYQVTTEIK